IRVKIVWGTGAVWVLDLAVRGDALAYGGSTVRGRRKGMSVSSISVRVAVLALLVALVTVVALVVGDGSPAGGLSTATKIYVG
ncbi:MAG: hypothetical protein SYR96_26650, partial [Actinomycetota bacterium]|nr:hypothetical protein [Actinomycetota bacterium]